MSGSKKKSSGTNTKSEKKRVRPYQDVKQATTALEYEIKSWKDKVLIQAPIAGRVALHKFWAANQRVNAADEVMSILPEATTTDNLFAYAYLAEVNSGKVREGQKVPIQRRPAYWIRKSQKTFCWRST